MRLEGKALPTKSVSNWDTSCVDWEARLLSGRSLVPDLPLFEKEAEVALRCFKRLRLPDVIGTPRMADACGPWFFPIVAALFGSYDKLTNVRHIQEVFQLVPKGNSKSSNGGAVMVTAIICNKRPEAEFLFIAPTMEIASIAYKQAKGTIRLDEELTKAFQVQDHIRKITHRHSGATLQIKAADTDVITGSKAVGTMIDETHVFSKRGNAKDVFVELRGALTKRPDGFLFQTTTQSKAPPSGVFASELEMARQVRDGKIKMPLLPVLYELPERLTKDNGWKDRRLWPIVNPNLGRSTNEEFLAREVERAEFEGPGSIALIASQHFNVQIGRSLRADGWAGADVWDRGVEPGLTLDAILARSEVITVGIDGGGLDDLLGIGIIGREKKTKRWLAWAHALISDIGLDRRKANAQVYGDFEKDGDLTKFDYRPAPTNDATELPENIAYVVRLVERIYTAGLLAQVGVDAAGIGAIVDALSGIGVTVDQEKLGAIRQGIALMGAIKTIEIKLADYSFRHSGSRMLGWCASNAIVVPTPTAMRIARDETGYGKIDPLMALFNAAALMAMNPEASGSYFDSDEFEETAQIGETTAEILANPMHPLWEQKREEYNQALAERSFKEDQFFEGT
jgi:phage terminase large subunit-like protein